MEAVATNDDIVNEIIPYYGEWSSLPVIDKTKSLLAEFRSGESTGTRSVLTFVTPLAWTRLPPIYLSPIQHITSTLSVARVNLPIL
jgi:hypothetical protein